MLVSSSSAKAAPLAAIAALSLFILLILAPGVAHLSTGITSRRLLAAYSLTSFGARFTFTRRSGLRILHLIDRTTEQALMDRWFSRSHASFAAEQDLVSEAILWGVGFPDYDASLSLHDNLVSRYGRPDHFDAILPYYNGDQANHLRWDPAPYFLELAEVSRAGRGVVIIDRPHEMRDARRVPILDLANVTLVLAPYPNELLEYQQYVDQALLVHQPHPVDPHLFYHPVEQRRDIDVYLAGSLEQNLYPLRHRLAGMIKSAVISNAAVRPHPGYPDLLSEEERRRRGIDEAFMERQLAEYSADFGRAKICLVTGSRWQYSVQKYIEAAAAGCLIAGTLPADRPSSFGDFVVPLSMGMSDLEINFILDGWLADESSRLARARRGQDWVLRHFSDRRYVEDVVSHVRAVQSGRRGLILPYEFRTLPEPLPWDG